MDLLKSKLAGFRKKLLTKSINFGTKKADYFVLGKKNQESILFLTGGSGVSEPFFEYMDYFSKGYKVISLDYPACQTLTELTELIIAIIKAENIKTINILGQSMGGMVAQVLMYRHPEVIKKVILSHTTTSSAEHRNSNNQEIKRKEKDIRLISKFPQFLLRKATKYRMKKVIKENNLINFEFWNTLFLQGVGKRNKNELISPLYLMIDFVKSYCFTVASFKNMAHKVLIIDSKADKSFTTAEKVAVCNIFPKAKEIHFEDKPHLGLIAYPDEYIDLIESFIS